MKDATNSSTTVSDSVATLRTTTLDPQQEEGYWDKEYEQAKRRVEIARRRAERIAQQNAA